ncbi:MAG: AEC family transporter, partial [Geminicoccaceae bacterium]
NSVVPLFAVIFLGYFCGRSGIIGEPAVKGLTTFVFYFALPPLLFRMMARSELGEVSGWAFIGAYLSTEILMFLSGALIAGAIFGLRFAERTIQGFGCAFSNGVLLTLPLLLWLYGEPGGVPALLIITLSALTFSTVTMLLELANRSIGSAGRRALLKHTLRSIAGNPIIMAAAGGLAYGLLGLKLPAVLDKTLGFIGQAGAPTALFALGGALSLRRIGGSLAPAGFMVAAKLFVHPFLVWLALFHLLEIDPLWANAGVIFAASPVGLNVYLFAQHYEAAVETASTAILISTGLAMITITGLLLLLPPIPA